MHLRYRTPFAIDKKQDPGMLASPSGWRRLSRACPCGLVVPALGTGMAILAPVAPGAWPWLGLTVFVFVTPAPIACLVGVEAPPAVPCRVAPPHHEGLTPTAKAFNISLQYFTTTTNYHRTIRKSPPRRLPSRRLFPLSLPLRRLSACLWVVCGLCGLCELCGLCGLCGFRGLCGLCELCGFCGFCGLCGLCGLCCGFCGLWGFWEFWSLVGGDFMCSASELELPELSELGLKFWTSGSLGSLGSLGSA